MPSSFTQILSIARNGLMTYLDNLDIVSNNMSNVGTVGYKANRGNFQEMLNEQILEGMKLSSTQNLMGQGSLRQTNNPLDLAIEGEGFFAIQVSGDRIGYSRDGQFFLDANQQLVNADGLRLVWDGAIPEDTNEVHINPDGVIMVLQDDIWSEAGSIPLSRFPNPTGLLSYGNNLWIETEASGEVLTGAALDEGFGQILGNAVEESNVDLGEEMSQMVLLQRGFEMTIRSFQQTDQMLYQAIHMRKG